MSETAVSAEDLDDFAARGSLVVRGKAVESMAVAAARATDEVVRHATGMRKLAGRGLPVVDVTVVGSTVRATVDVAVEWPTPAAAVAARVRESVARDLAAYGDYDVARVDVTVKYVTPTDNSGRVR